MRIGLLGALEVFDDDGYEITVAGAKLRALLAVLALHVGRVVAADYLVDALWGEDPPAAVRNGLQGLASKLRRALGSSDLVVMRNEGYVLDLPPDVVDVERFGRRAADGRALAVIGELERAVDVLAEADSLWRGEPLAEFAYDDFAVSAIARLSESRLALLEERLDLELRLGRHQRAVVQLEQLVADHPLREGLRGLLMLALYRAGRQVDALRVFQDGRGLLAEELGLEPGPALRRLESAILVQDPSLTLPAASASPVGAGSHPMIPEALTPLIGRDVELRELRELFAEQRFVTLVGPGGVGKTRLALEVGRAAAVGLSFGGCVVELAPVGDPAGVPAAIAAALGLPDPNRIAEMIGDHDLVVVLDNCEHVIDAAAEAAEGLLRRCPGLRLLATSREGLRVGGETIWPVPPLAPDDAVRLFVGRARASGAPVGLDDKHDLIADICARLDGLPLAIELAAARTRAFPLSQIAARLNDRFRLLTGGSRTALPRQQTLRAVVDWSYELLFDDEQRVFERLAVLPGGCDLATAEAVCADDDIAVDDIAEHLRALVDKSLVIAVPVTDGGVRFSLLQTLAQYGRERLTERGDAVRIRDTMATHYAQLCAQSATAYSGDVQRAWLTAIDAEHDNLRAALEWAIANDDAETALLIAGGAAWPHWLTGMVVEGLRWLDDAFACRGAVTERTRALGLTGRGLLEFLAGATERSDDDLAEALEIFERHGDVESMVLAHSFYSEQAAVRGDLDEARRRRRVLLDFYDQAPEDPFAAAARVYSLAKLALLDGDLVAAERHYRAATDGFQRLDRPVMASICLGMVADFDERAGDYPAAIATLEAAIATNESLLVGFTGALYARLGWVLLHDGQLDRAEAVYGHALESARRVRHTMVIFQAQAGMAILHRLQRRDDAAVDAATEALELYRAGGFRRFRNRIDPTADLRAAAAVSCEVLAITAAERAQPERAATLLGEAAGLRHGTGEETPTVMAAEVASAREGARAALGEDASRAAFERGQQGVEVTRVA